MRHHAIEVVDATTERIKLALLTTLISGRMEATLTSSPVTLLSDGVLQKTWLFSQRRYRFFHPPPPPPLSPPAHGSRS